MTPYDRAILEFARLEFKWQGSRDTAIRAIFGMSATLYFADLNRILDTPGAVAYDPPLVNRLRRIRDRRAAARTRSTR